MVNMNSLSIESNNIVKLLEKLNGYKAPIRISSVNTQELNKFPSGGIGYSQFNELQLSLGFNRINRTFFQFLLDNSVDIKEDMYFKNIDELKASIDRFRILALFFFGNIRH